MLILTTNFNFLIDQGREYQYCATILEKFSIELEGIENLINVC